MSTPQPWTMEQRSAKKRKVDKEAARMAARVGAKGVYVVAFFPDGNYLHMIDGGITPMPAEELHRQMLASIEKLKLSGGEDIQVQ